MSNFLTWFLKHENTIVAAIVTDGYNRVADVRIANTHWLPFLHIDTGKSQKEELIQFINDRGVPAKRLRLREELREIGCSSPFELMIRNYGLSLVDHYWICPTDKNITWEEINLYTNDFRSSINLDTFKETGKGHNFIPSASLKGDLKKKWIIAEDGTRYLAKGNYNNTCRQSISEVLATEIHKRQGKFEYTPYSFSTLYCDKQKITGCICPNFTSEYTEFVPAIDIVCSKKKDNSISNIQHYINVCEELGINKNYMYNWISYCILTNFVITNIDWHLNNFGIIMDSKTKRAIKPAPIFDSGNSMFYRHTGSDIRTESGLLNIEVTSWTHFEVELLKYVTNSSIVDIELLPTEDEVHELLKVDKYVSQSDNERLLKAYRNKIKLLKEFQSGTKLYDYKYLKSKGIKLKRKNKYTDS